MVCTSFSWNANYTRKYLFEVLLFSQVDVQVASSSKRTRRTHFNEFFTVCDAIYEYLCDFVPGHYLDDNGPRLAGRSVDIHDLHMTTASLGKDDAFNNNIFKNAALIILDGSGTEVLAPADHLTHTELYCHWKGRTMYRWYIVVDAGGKLLYLSNVYPGKIDDNTVLEKTFFYR